MVVRLEPCPFCGCEVSGISSRYGLNGLFLFVQCDVCGAESKKFGVGRYANVPDEDNEFWGCEKVQQAVRKVQNAWNMRRG